MNMDILTIPQLLWFGVMGLALALFSCYFAFCVFGYFDRRKRTVEFKTVPLPTLGPFDGPDVSCTCKNACDRHTSLPESAIIGSNFTSVPISKIPRVQLPLYSVDESGNLHRFLGSAIRVGDYLVVPYHIIVAFDVVAGLVMAGRLPKPYKLDTKDFVKIDGDVAAMKMAESTFSVMGLVKAGIAPVESDMMSSICSSTKEPEISFGLVMNDKKVFGGLIFHGSTKGGFSGSPYMSGSQLVGMHLGGGMVNYGVSASYIHALLVKPEDTAEWLQRVRRRRGPLIYQRSKFHPGEAIVFVNGKYVTVDLDVLEEEDVQEDGKVTSEEVRFGEINRAENFPPQYCDTADMVVTAINGAVLEHQERSLNLTAAGEYPADQADQYLEWHQKMVSQLDEKVMLLQSVADSLSNRYREVERLLLTVKGEGREAVVAENEQIKKELTAVNKLKKDANVEISSVKVIPKEVKKAKASKANASLLDQVAVHYSIEKIIRALEERGLVKKIVAEGDTIVKVVETAKKSEMTESPSTSTK